MMHNRHRRKPMPTSGSFREKGKIFTGPGAGGMKHRDLPVILPVVLISIIIIVVIISIGLGCWCYHRKKRRRDLADLTKKGGVVVITDQHSSNEGRLVVNVSYLNHPEHSVDNVYNDPELKHQRGESLTDKRLESVCEKQPSNSIPLTEDGYATLEPEDANSTDQDQPRDYISPLNKMSGYDHLQTAQSIKNDEANVNENDNHDYEELFWEPANQEEELMAQLSTLGLPVILSENIDLQDCLGTGEFGTVHRGLWTSRSYHGVHLETKETVVVAVKSIKEAAGEEMRVKFLQEVAIMGQFKHPNILRVLGVVFEEPMKLVVEIMPKGDLLRHLISLRPEEGQSQCKELGALLLSYTRQVAMGMVYLSIKEYVHRDLAARNVLVSDDGVCKIADFGLSRNLQQGDYYVSQGGKIPVKWTAPEALHYHKYSTASDVWSYGCLLYEIWSLGCKPFHDITNAEVIQKVLTGYRLPPPPGCPRSIYKIMIECWNPTPMLRPKLCHTLVSLQQPDFRILKWSEEDLATCDSENAKVFGSPVDDGFCLYKDLQSAYSEVDYEMDSNRQAEDF